VTFKMLSYLGMGDVQSVQLSWHEWRSKC